MTRPQLATDIASGLAGWLQLQHVQNMGGMSGEDTARFFASQIINAQGRYAPATSQLPPNWGNTKKRVDVALKGRSGGATTWYGAIEIKWPGDAFDPHTVRQAIAQDAMRLAFIEASRPNARLVVVGGSDRAIDVLFDKDHPQSRGREARRVSFGELFKRDMSDAKGHLTAADWRGHFSDIAERIPDSVFRGFDGRLKVELLAECTSTVGDDPVGHVYVWNCTRTRGTASGTP